MWHASRLLRRDGMLVGGSPERVSLRLRMEGLFLWVLEHLIAKTHCCGEEIVLVACKGKGP